MYFLVVEASITAMNYLFGSVYCNYYYAYLNYDLCFICSGKKKNLQKCHEQKSKIDSKKKKKSIHKRNIHLIIAKLEDNSEIIILL